MKKVISILLVLCVAVTLFAAGSVKVGGAFNFVTGGTRDIENTIYTTDSKTTVDTKKDATYKVNGFGFDISGDFDVAQNLAIWADFNMVFCTDAKYEFDGEKISLEEDYVDLEKLFKDKAYRKINIVSFGAGVAYKFTFNPVDVKLGGGLFLDRGYGKVGSKIGDEEYYELFKAVNFGLALYADASYKFNNNFGIGIKAMPHIGLYNSTSVIIDGIKNLYPSAPFNKQEQNAKGLKLSFAMPIVVGVSYSF